MFNHLDSFLTLGDYRTLFGVWNRAIAIALAKAQSATIRPTRKSNGNDISYPAIPQALSEVDIFGRNIVNKPGIYPYGSATGTTPVTSTSLKAGTYKRAKIKGKGVTKRKQNKLWGRYIPAVASNTTTYPMVLKNLFDEATVTKGEFYNDSGVLTINEATYYSAPVPASQGDVFTISRESAVTTVYLRIHAFNADGTWLAMIGKSAETTSTSVTSSACPANTAYIVVCGAHRNGAIDPHTMVVKGSTAHLYVPYGSWKFVKDTVANTFGYFNEATLEYVSVAGATGTLIQPISYAESDGTQYIDTGISNVKNSRFEIDAQVLDLTGIFPTILGSYLNSKFKIVLGFGSGSKFYTQCGTGSASYTYGPRQDTDRHKFIVENTTDSVKITVDTTVKTDSYTINDDDGSNLYLFARHIAAGVANYTSIKAYSVRIWDNGTPVRDYLPVRIGTTVELLDLVSWTYATRTGTFTAGADVPYTDLCPDILETNVGDALYGQYGKNLFDKDKTTYHMYYTPQGVWQTASSVSSSDFIEVKPNTTYVLSGESFSSGLSKRINLLDANKNWISQPVANVNYPLTVTTTANTKYIRFSFGETDSGIDTNIQFEIGSTPTPYEPYHFGLHPSGKQKLFMGEQGVITFDGSSDENWAYDSTYGRFSITVSDAKVGTTRTIQAYAPGWNCLWNREPIENVQNGDFYVGTTNILFHSGETSVADWKAKIQAKPITLYYQRSTDSSFIPPTIREFDTFLPSANSFIDPQKPSNNVECDWKFKVLDGTDYQFSNVEVSGDKYWFYNLDFQLPYITEADFGNVLSDHFVGGRKSISGTTMSRSGVGYVQILGNGMGGATTVAEANAWIKEHHPIIAFPLATPEVTTVTISELTQPLGTVTILNEFADGTKGAVDFYGVNIQIDNPVPKPDEPFPLLSNAGEVKVGYIQTQGKVVYDGSSDEVWTYDSGFHRFYLGSASLPADMKLGGTRTQQMFAPNWRCLWHGEAVSTAVNGDFYVGSSNVFFHSPEVSVAAFKAMLQTNPIELYYQRTSDPSFIQPTNGFFGDGQQTVKMEGVNLFNKNSYTEINAYINSTTGLITAGTSSSDTQYCFVIPCKPNTTYTMNTANYTSAWGTFESSAIGTTATQRTMGNGTLTSGPNDKYLIGLIRTGAGTYDFRNTLMLAEGSTALPYEPYVTPQTVTTSEILPSATSKLNMQGGSNNKDCDVVLVQLDGTETGWNISSGTGWVRFYRTFDDAKSGSIVTSTHFKYHSSNNEPGVIRFGATTKQCYLYPNLDVDSVVKFQAWLAANKPIIAYELDVSAKSTVTTQRLEITAKNTDLTITSQFSDGASADLAVTYLGDPEPPLRAVKFTAEQANSTISLAGATGTNYKYSTDGKTFNAYTSGTTITLANIGDSVWFQGVHNENVTYSMSSGHYSQFTMTGKIAASGNVDWLLDPDFDDTNNALPRNVFYKLFYNNASLTSAPELPATTLGTNCYGNMFYGCTSLTTAYALPATTLADSCYGAMFYNCTSLTSAPELPATTLGTNCYANMFYGCTSLTSAPELPATTLADYCYYNMFYGCTNLVSAPELPATALADSCYDSMFYNCTSLTSAPELLATTLADSCYYNMFYGASELNYVVLHATSIPDSYCLMNWLKNVKSTGTLKCPSSLSLSSGASGLPSGWTRVNL